jgi:23S rRNA (adenine2503-C2)-methyltransferase
MEKSRCHLAISLHHPNHEERKKMMPIENKYPVSQVIEQLKTYDLNRQRRISFEYIMLGGVNDSPREINEMTKLLSGLRCRINLIPFHAIPDSPFKPSGKETIQRFATALQQRGMIVTIRQSRGLDIDAACGLLSTNRNLQ